jgi:tripartite-type tricarboxylate transporter receptor subunit TctC
MLDRRIPRTHVRSAFSSRIFAVLACIACAIGGAAHAQSWPGKPIHMIVPFAPGGGTDVTVRIVGPRLGEALGQPVVVDYKAGAGTMIGTEFTARAPADGYTIMIASASHALNPSLHSKVAYHPTRDFQALTMGVSFPFVLAVTNTLPVSNVKELIAAARADPGKLSFASSGVGSTPHLAGEVFKSMTGTSLVHVPYKGGGPALNDVIAGQVPVTFSTAVETLPQVRAGKLRGLAVSSVKRAATAPELPTIAEAGVPGYDVTGWYVFLAPAGTPKAIIGRLNQEITRILQTPAARDQLLALAAEPWPTTPAVAQDYIASETQRWAQVIRQANIKPD